MRCCSRCWIACGCPRRCGSATLPPPTRSGSEATCPTSRPPSLPWRAARAAHPAATTLATSSWATRPRRCPPLTMRARPTRRLRTSPCSTCSGPCCATRSHSRRRSGGSWCGRGSGRCASGTGGTSRTAGCRVTRCRCRTRRRTTRSSTSRTGTRPGRRTERRRAPFSWQRRARCGASRCGGCTSFRRATEAAALRAAASRATSSSPTAPRSTPQRASSGRGSATPPAAGAQLLSSTSARCCASRRVALTTRPLRRASSAASSSGFSAGSTRTAARSATRTWTRCWRTRAPSTNPRSRCS
mmetsp:Transcript_20646/g.66011  ORF Transcript_20646/g.66011 Transcript_20646/m.66011 type:complete len:300 (-) Transcript_20646:249-1148(-)